MQFEGKSVVVTGASSGMGWSIALAFAKEGATVVAVARRKERLEKLAEEAAGFPGKILPFSGDLSQKQVNESMLDYAIETCGKLDILVNNAGIMDEFKPIGEMSDAHWEHILQINLYAPMYAMRKAVQRMCEQQTGGVIVNVASIGGVRGCRAGCAYTAAKHALIGMTQNTAYMYAPKGIRCNAICPGGVETEVMNSQTNISEYGIGRVMAGLDQAIPAGKPEDIAEAVLYAASDRSRFLNGAALVVDGGVSCN